MNTLRVFAGLVLAGMLAFAQSGNVVKVTLPYEVRVADSVLPAGEYEIQVLKSSSDIPQILFRPGKGGREVLAIAGSVPTYDGAPAGATVVAFEKRGNAFQLKRIWIEGWAMGYEFR